LATFTHEEIEERKLEAEIIKNPEALEKGLIVLDHQVPAGRGKIDVLSVDSGGIMCVIELKTVEDDAMLLQALEYLDWVNNNLADIARRYQEKYPKIRFNVEEVPRVVLVAPSFSGTLLKSAKFVDPKPDLFEYRYLRSASGERGLYCRSIQIEPMKELPIVRSIDDHLNYIKNIPMRTYCKEVIDRIKKIGEGIEVRAIKWHIAFKYEGRVLAYIAPRRDFFYLYYPKRSDWYSEPISSKRDFKSDMYDGIKDFYMRLRGE